jgi:hypothetical protein
VIAVTGSLEHRLTVVTARGVAAAGTPCLSWRLYDLVRDQHAGFFQGDQRVGLQ